MPPLRFAILIAALSFAAGACAQTAPPGRPVRAAFEEPIVDIATACPGVVIELRYATNRNITGKPIYPAGASALLRQSVAERLNRAQAFLRDRGFGLKVWDAYRPPSAQKALWNAVRNSAYVVEPTGIGSLHGWGAAVDVTLVDFRGREVPMPTDFDAFTSAARYDYKGGDPEVAFNLSTLKRAMADAGFRHIRDEWWHYSVPTVPGGRPIDIPLTAPRIAQEAAAPKPKAPAKKSAGEGRLLFAPKADDDTL